MLTMAEADALFARRRDAWLREDIDAYLACWAEDMTFVSPVHQEPVRGRDAYAALIRRRPRRCGRCGSTSRTSPSADDVVLAEWEIEAEHRASGARLRWRGMSAAGYRDGPSCGGASTGTRRRSVWGLSSGSHHRLAAAHVERFAGDVARRRRCTGTRWRARPRRPSRAGRAGSRARSSAAASPSMAPIMASNWRSLLSRSVSTVPGHTAFTVIPAGAQLLRQHLGQQDDARPWPRSRRPASGIRACRPVTRR